MLDVISLFRYPVKSLAGEALDAADIGFHGIDGDRRFAFRRVEERGGKPWLTASKLAELVTFTPVVRDGELVTVRAPDGRILEVGDLDAEVTHRHGHPVQLMRLAHGIFDEAPISVIGSATIDAIAAECGLALDIRRFRPNLFVRTERPFEEDTWVGKRLAFADSEVELAVTMRDERCVMVNIDPDSAATDARVFKAIVRMHGVDAGVYATVTRPGRLGVGVTMSVR